jgi:transposase
MVHTPIIPVKSATPHFATPPWDRSSPQWIDIDQRLPHDHLARLIDEAVARLDLQPLLRSYAGRGSRAYHPALMLRIVLYQLACGVHQPGRWARNCRLHDELKWLGFGICPSRSRFYHFQGRLGDQLDAWSQQVIAQAIARGLTTATRAALDGSTIAANASRHRMLNRKTLDQRLVVLAQAVAADGPAAEATAPTATPPAPDGPGPAPATTPRPWSMATTPHGRRRQLARYQDARAALGRRIAANARRKAERRRDPETIVIAPGDPEATPGRDKLAVFRPLYNAQIAYDLDSELILAAEVFAQQNDTGTLPVMLTVFTSWVGHVPSVLLTDAGYATVIDATACAAAGVVLYAPYQTNDYSHRGASPAAAQTKTKTKTKTKEARPLPKERFTWDATHDVYVCPSGHAMPWESSKRERRAGEQSVVRHFYRCAGEHCQACPLRAACTPNPSAGRSVSRVEGEEVIEALRARMQTPEAKALYKRRRSTVERSYADLKVHRRLDRFSGRGLARVRAQLRLQCLVHNLLVVARHARASREEQGQKRLAG